ncbi:beta-ketoacyl-[acyl-carrier-protein] synthase family protein [Tundrisphaera sp. TA3]|uniref:beta-ketoacyl-[acyl-carrier-protein] synthase family protein n=1 Tax=Tundrisphaera sp. TA3 TaxID=3435775 RepID=UPI003EBA2BCF
MTDPDRAVVITGIGLATALGLGRDATWAAIHAGRSGAAWIEGPGFDPGHAGYPIAWPTPTALDLDPAHRLLDLLADEALADAGFDGADPRFDPDRAAALIGLSKGGVRSLARLHEMIRAGSSDDAAMARAWSDSWPGAGASRVAHRLGFGGPCVGPVAACATGLVAVLQAADLLRRGACDIALAGGADASIEPIVLGAFRKMKALARIDGDPSSAIRPWDRDRSGFLVGEGGAILVLERLDSARRRGVVPYAEVAGGALGADAHHETALDPDPANLAGVIRRALRDARVDPSEIDAAHVHGTATAINDPLECRALRLALGPHADRVACSASKPQIGHLLGAAGSAELALAALSVRDGFAPPTLNLDHPDPACDLDGTPGAGRSLPIRAALKLSLGFGGHLAVAVLRRVEG